MCDRLFYKGKSGITIKAKVGEHDEPRFVQVQRGKNSALSKCRKAPFSRIDEVSVTKLGILIIRADVSKSNGSA